VIAVRIFRHQVLVTENEEKQRFIATHGETGDLPSWDCVTDVDEFIPRSVLIDFERGHVIVK
jgi:hypothetical protein